MTSLRSVIRNDYFKLVREIEPPLQTDLENGIQTLLELHDWARSRGISLKLTNLTKSGELK